MGNSNGLKRLRRLIESSNRHSDGLYTQDMFKLKERPDGSYQMFDGTIISAKDMNKPGVRFKPFWDERVGKYRLCHR